MDFLLKIYEYVIGVEFIDLLWKSAGDFGVSWSVASLLSGSVLQF